MVGLSVLSVVRMLQWGHDFDVVEDFYDLDSPDCKAPELQWGHDFDVVEDEPAWVVGAGPFPASMGPRL